MSVSEVGHHRPPWVVVVAASAGGIAALKTLLSELPADLPAAVVIVQHRSIEHQHTLERILRRKAKMPVTPAKGGESLRAGHAYVARADLHLTIRPEGRFSYVDGSRVCFVLSSANPLFQTAASAFQKHAIAVVLTGAGSDGTDGVRAVKAAGGIVIAQDQSTAAHGSMPRSAVATGAVDRVLPIHAIAPAIVELVSRAGVAS